MWLKCLLTERFLIVNHLLGNHNLNSIGKITIKILKMIKRLVLLEFVIGQHTITMNTLVTVVV